MTHGYVRRANNCHDNDHGHGLLGKEDKETPGDVENGC